MTLKEGKWSQFSSLYQPQVTISIILVYSHPIMSALYSLGAVSRGPLCVGSVFSRIYQEVSATTTTTTTTAVPSSLKSLPRMEGILFYEWWLGSVRESRFIRVGLYFRDPACEKLKSTSREWQRLWWLRWWRGLCGGSVGYSDR